MRRFVPIFLAISLLLIGAACGGGTTKDTGPESVEGTLPAETQAEAPAEGDPEAGKEVFVSAGCGGCHIFEPAGSSGTAGPNLDESKPGYEDAYDQIANGGGGMPAFKDQLNEKEIADVAAFVAGSNGG